MDSLKIKIYGAGSVGNHFAYSCRHKSWDVTVCDIDTNALERMQSQVYPARYGKWDQSIRLCTPEKVSDENFDLVIVGTPPSSHSEIAIRELKSEKRPRALLIEKPLSFASDINLLELKKLADQSETKVFVGYNHQLSPAIQVMKEKIKSAELGEIKSIFVEFREDSKFILDAHNWIKSIKDTYLGSNEKGGGAGFEHSHGMSLWLYLAEAAGLLPLKAVSALHSTSDRQEDHGHDIIFNAQFENQYGFCGSVTQDFVSRPPIKQAQVQGSLGRIQWANVYGANSEEVTLFQESAELVFKFPKARSTDFLKELEHIERYLSGGKIGDEVSWERGYATMQALNKSYESIAKGQKIELNISL